MKISIAIRTFAKCRWNSPERVVPGIGTTGTVAEVVSAPAVLEATVVVSVVEVTLSGAAVEEATVVVSVVEVTPP